MARVDIINFLCSKQQSPLDFHFDTLMARPLLSYITQQDIQQLHQIATSIKLSSKPKQKYKMIDDILVPRGFKKLASGTNRVAYKCLNDQGIILKVALDSVGLSDSPAEYRNQFLLKPFVTKVFEVSPCGTVALVERVQPITSREEYIQIAPDVFDLLVNKILGKYVMEDIGTKYFQNIGLRLNFGPVLLDFPYLFELDGNKLFCNERLDNGQICGGTIDYDSGFNKLICEKCGKQYFARQLGKYKQDKKIIISKGDIEKMNIVIARGNEVVETLTTKPATETYRKPALQGTVRGYDSFIKREEAKIQKQQQKQNKAPQTNKQKCNENVTSASLGGHVEKNVFKNPDIKKEIEEQKKAVESESVLTSPNLGTNLGNLIPDLNTEEPTPTEDSKDEFSEENHDAESVIDDLEEELSVEEESKESFPEVEVETTEEEEELPDFISMVDPSIGDEEDEDGVVYTSEIKPIKDEEVEEVISKLSSAY